ncbi:SAM-dependent methyltransferase [Parvularcula lutaonensis]|nr:SAM-dependent methyltransferase [Parvularcula lutaonensis]
MTDDPRLYSTSAARNKEIIAEAFARLCPYAERVLELASGTGEHAEAVLARMPNLHWQASDPDGAARASSTARMAELGQPEAKGFDTRRDGWWQAVERPVDTIVAINMIHITSIAGYENLFRGAAALLPENGALFLYGPMSRRGEMEESNHRFDESLRMRDPAWGVRDLDDTLQPLGARFALTLDHVERVPANNHVVLFRRTGR